MPSTGWTIFANFNPRSPCGERHKKLTLKVYRHKISIHALLAESDNLISLTRAEHNISIHALLAESDPMMFRRASQLSLFQSTLSLRRATAAR